MFNYANLKLIKIVYFLPIIVYIKSIISKEIIELNQSINHQPKNYELNYINQTNINRDCNSLNIIKSYILKSTINDNYKELELGYNIIDFNEQINNYSLDLTNINKTEKEILLNTNISNGLFFILENDEEHNVSAFEIFTNDFIMNHDNISFKMYRQNISGQGFIDFLLVGKGEYHLNYNVVREEFYEKNIILNKDIFKKQYFINFVPNDNNSELYYLQFNYDASVESDEKEKIKLFYINSVSNNGINGTIENLKKKEMKRDRKINGKIEIFAYEYNDLNNDINLTLHYNRIKGEGIFGFIISMSALFAILLIIVIIYVKNVYFEYNIIKNIHSQETIDDNEETE